VSREKITVYVEGFTAELLRLESIRQNRSISNLCENLIIEGLSDSSFLMSHSDLAVALPIPPDELAASVPSPDDWPEGYQWIPIFQKWIPIMMEKK
jgi:hypothetical protein